MFTRQVLAIVSVVALGGFLAVLEPDDENAPRQATSLVTQTQR